MLRASTLLVLLVAASTVTAAVPGQAFTPNAELDATWDPDVRLTNNTYSDFDYWSCQRRVVQGPDGRVHVAWHVMNSGLGTYNMQVYYKRYNPGAGWSNDTMISEDLYIGSTWNKYASLAVDSTGRVWLVWGNGGSTNADDAVYYKTCVPTGTGNDGWDVSSQLLSVNPASYTKACPNVAATPDGHVHVTWKENQNVAYREWDGSSWSSQVDIVTGWSLTFYPSVAGARDNTVHVAFHGRQGSSGYYKIHYVARSAAGVWGSVESPSGTGGDHQMYPSVTCSPVTNEPHVVWQGDGQTGLVYLYRIVHAWRTAGAWQVDTASETTADYDPAETQMGFTADGTGHVVWAGISDSSPTLEQIRYRELSPAGVWGDFIDLTDTTGSKERPSIAGGGSGYPTDIHVAWQDYRDGNSEMYYKHGALETVRDVGVSALVAPPDTVDSGYAVVPACTVYNYGNTVESYWVRMKIGTFYEDTFKIDDHAPGASIPVDFADWIPDQLGDFAVSCSTELGPDENNANDAQNSTVTVVEVVHDVGVTAILAPHDTVFAGVPIIPACSLFNYGTVDEESVEVRCEVEGGPFVVDFMPQLMRNPGGGYLVFTQSFLLPQGEYEFRVLTNHPLDQDRSNDTIIDSLVVLSNYTPGWVEMEPMPLGPLSRPVKRGGWLVGRGDRLYAGKGYKTNEFYGYDILADTWWALAPMPYQSHPLWYNKPPRKGSKAVRDGGDLYVTQGNNSLGFWLYDISADTWGMLPDVPLGPYRKKVKGGTDMVQMSVQGEPGYIYLLKGYKTEFYRFNTETMVWDTMLTEAPTGARAKWDKGSWLVSHRRVNQDLYHIYAHKAKYNELWRYDVLGDSWTGLTGMPFIGSLGRSKKSKDGGSGVWEGGCIYALKGGNTQEFWKYWSDGDSWVELDTMPSLGSTGKKKRVKYGADLESYESGVFFALKGNKTRELWRYYELPVPLETGRRQRDARDGSASGPASPAAGAMSVAPNPLSGGFATVHYDLPQAGPVHIRVYDIAGRERLGAVYGFGRQASGVTLDLRSLSPGVYLVRLEAPGFAAARKLVVE